MIPVSSALRVRKAIEAAGVPVVGLSIGSETDKSTWKVQPTTLQTAAQPIIDAFDPNDPTFAQADADAAVDALLNAIDGDVLTAVLKNLPAMQAEVTAGTYKHGQWKLRLRNEIKTSRRANKGGG